MSCCSSFVQFGVIAWWEEIAMSDSDVNTMTLCENTRDL